MLTFSNLLTLYQTLTNDTSSQNQADGAVWMNQAYRQVCAVRPWYWLEGTNTTNTVANQQDYDFPYDYDKLIDFYITIGNWRYVPYEIVSQIQWDQQNQQTAYTSNYPYYYHIYNGKLQLWPTPSTSDYVLTFHYRKNVVDLSIANYTTGTVATAGTAAITGSGTSWNSSLIGQYFQVPQTATAATDGDGFWYKVAAVGGTTSLTLDKAYAGPNLTGASYVIGQTPAIPEAFQDMIAYKAAQQYYLIRNPDNTRVQNIKMIYDEKWDGLVQDSKKSTDTWVRTDNPYGMENPNNFWLIT